MSTKSAIWRHVAVKADIFMGRMAKRCMSSVYADSMLLASPLRLAVLVTLDPGFLRGENRKGMGGAVTGGTGGSGLMWPERGGVLSASVSSRGSTFILLAGGVLLMPSRRASAGGD